MSYTDLSTQGTWVEAYRDDKGFISSVFMATKGDNSYELSMTPAEVQNLAHGLAADFANVSKAENAKYDIPPALVNAGGPDLKLEDYLDAIDRNLGIGDGFLDSGYILVAQETEPTRWGSAEVYVLAESMDAKVGFKIAIEYQSDHGRDPGGYLSRESWTPVDLKTVEVVKFKDVDVNITH